MQSEDEFQSYWGFDKLGNIFETNANSGECYPSRTYQAPSRVNWQERGMVTAVKNQQRCGSCWAFATNAALESAYLRHHKAPVNLSEQQLVDCAVHPKDGCEGGNAFLAYRYIKTHGVTTTAHYHYTGTYQGCRTNLPRVAQIRGRCIRGQNFYSFTLLPETLSDDDIKRAVAHFGPVTVCLNASRLKNYKSGYFDDSACSTHINHMVLLVGYDHRGWILKNSWGLHWGDNGYFRLVTGKNMCGINFEISYPLV